MKEFPLNFLTLPVWWYTSGIQIWWRWFLRLEHFTFLKSGVSQIARHMYEPLYGDYTSSGKFLSFFLRIFLLVGKSISLTIKTLILLLFGVIFVLWLPLVFAMIFVSILNIYG